MAIAVLLHFPPWFFSVFFLGLEKNAIRSAKLPLACKPAIKKCGRTSYLCKLGSAKPHKDHLIYPPGNHYISHKREAGKSSTQKCRLVRDMWSFPRRVCNSQFRWIHTWNHNTSLCWEDFTILNQHVFSFRSVGMLAVGAINCSETYTVCISLSLFLLSNNILYMNTIIWYQTWYLPASSFLEWHNINGWEMPLMQALEGVSEILSCTQSEYTNVFLPRHPKPFNDFLTSFSPKSTSISRFVEDFEWFWMSLRQVNRTNCYELREIMTLWIKLMKNIFEENMSWLEL